MHYGILQVMLHQGILVMIIYGLEEVSDNIGIELVPRHNLLSLLLMFWNKLFVLEKPYFCYKIHQEQSNEKEL